MSKRQIYRTHTLAYAEAYHGYLIKYVGRHGYTISKDGYHISFAQSVDEAKSIIDMLV